MLNLTKIKSIDFDDIKRRIVKVLRKGNSDIQTSIECGPFGVDSGPLKDMIAVYGPTEEKGKTVIIGYLNKNQKADVGQLRLYSTKTDGTEMFYVWLKNNDDGIGNLELGGTVDNAVRYQKLDDGLQQFKNLIQTELGKIQIGIAAGGGSYTPGTLTADISAAKIEEIKTL